MLVAHLIVLLMIEVVKANLRGKHTQGESIVNLGEKKVIFGLFYATFL